MFAKSLAALPGAAVRAGARGPWTPSAQLARRGPWSKTTTLTAMAMQVRMDSTVIDRPTIYNDGMPPPPPAPVAAQRLESRPASDFQAFKSPQETASEPSIPVQTIENVSEGADAHTEANRKMFMDAVNATAPRNDWTRKEVAAIYYQPMLELAHQAVSLLPRPSLVGTLFPR